MADARRLAAAAAFAAAALIAQAQGAGAAASGPATAASPAAPLAVPTAANPTLEARMLAITGELRCLVCQNQTIADSHADLAADLRKEVRELLAQGKSDQQIRDYMTARYGDFVLYRPPLKATTVALWAGPAALLAIALAALLVTIARRRRLGDERFEADPDWGAEPDARDPVVSRTGTPA